MELQGAHELLELYVKERVGRPGERLSTFACDLFRPLLIGVVEQLSVYAEMTPGARLSAHEARIRSGPGRTFILLELRDRGGPLRLREATQRFDMEIDNQVDHFARDIGARRWRFVERNLTRVIEPAVRNVLSAVDAYYASHPYAVLEFGLTRLLESVEATYLCCEIDVREKREGPKETAASYRV